MQESEWAFGVTAAHAWCESRLAVFRTTGLFGDSEARPILEAAQGAMDRWGALALLADYQHADVQIDAVRLHAHAASVAAGDGGLRAPTALVVVPDQREMWALYARLMARAGILRGVFTEYEPALRWLRLQAAVAEADHLRRTRASAR